MPISVKLPDGSVAQFPDGTSNDVMKAAIQKRFPVQKNTSGSPDDRSAVAPPLPTGAQANYNLAIKKVATDNNLSPQAVDYLKQQYDPSLWNLARSGTTFGLSDELSGLSGGLANMLIGKDFGQGYGDFSDLQNRTIDLAREKNGMLGSAAELVPSLMTMGPERAAVEAAVSQAPRVAQALPGYAKAIASGAGTGAILGGIGGFTNTDGDVQQRAEGGGKGALAGALLGGVTGGIGRSIAGLSGRGAAISAPSVDDLKAQAGAIYDSARASGAKMNQNGTISLSDDMHNLAVNEGLVSPTGRVSSSYPKINEALKMFDDYSGGEMTVAQMQSMRKTLQGAAKSSDANESRIGVEMLRQFDDFVSQGVPELKDAAAIYHRAKKGELIETAIELAGSRAGQFSGSGFENALRTEFRGLDRQIIKGQLKGVTQAEQDAIKKVANGGGIENVARWFGKYAPTGVIPTTAALGIGNMIGGPLGAGAGAVISGVGLAGRLTGTALQKRNAAIASALMRRGAPAVMSPTQTQIGSALLNGGMLGAGVGGYQAGRQLAGAQ